MIHIKVNSSHESKSKATFLQSAFAGGVAGAFTRGVFHPLDVLKIRFQLQVEPVGKGAKYSSIPQAIHSIVKEEGICALWSGHVPAQMLSISYGIIQFSVFEKLTQQIQRRPEFYTSNKHWVNFCNGAVAATIATMATFPCDTLRTRLIAEEKIRKVYKGLINAFVTMVRTEGPMALYKGLFPTLGQIAPHTGIQFATYKLLTQNVFNKMEFFQRPITIVATIESTMLANLLAGSIAGFVAKTAIYPFDLAKKRLQIQGFQQHRRMFGRQMYCSGFLHCIKLIITEEGFMALFKGYWPSALKAVLVSASHFAVYDEVKHFFTKLQ